MPAFTVKSTDRLAQYFHGMTDHMANQMWTMARSFDYRESRTALRYTIARNGKNHPASMLIVLCIDRDDDNTARIITDEYHPRRQGKADLDFRTDYIQDDND
jgi:hypothetical protein